MYKFSQKLSNKSRFTMLLSQWHFCGWFGLSRHTRKKKRFTILEGFLSAITFSLLSGLG